MTGGEELLRFYAKGFRFVCSTVFLLGLFGTSGCALLSGSKNYLPPYDPQTPNVLSTNPKYWYIQWSNDMPANPLPNPAGEWSFNFPIWDQNTSTYGHVNYVESPFKATKTPQAITLTFKVESTKPQYKVFGDWLPATFRPFFEIKNDDMSSANGRWWGIWPYYVYKLGSNDNQVEVFTVPLTPSHWSNVYGKLGTTEPTGFYNSLKNVGYFGVTFGGSHFAGHGVALSGGTAKFVMISYKVLY